MYGSYFRNLDFFHLLRVLGEQISTKKLEFRKLPLIHGQRESGMPLCSYSPLATRAHEVVTQSHTPGIGRSTHLASGGPRAWNWEVHAPDVRRKLEDQDRDPGKKSSRIKKISSNRKEVLVPFRFFFFCLEVQYAGSLLPDQELNPCTLHCEWIVLRTGLPGKSLSDYFIPSEVKVSRKDSLCLTWQ